MSAKHLFKNIIGSPFRIAQVHSFSSVGQTRGAWQPCLWSLFFWLKKVHLIWDSELRMEVSVGTKQRLTARRSECGAGWVSLWTLSIWDQSFLQKEHFISSLMKQLVLETRGEEEDIDPLRAYWNVCTFSLSLFKYMHEKSVIEKQAWAILSTLNPSLAAVGVLFPGGKRKMKIMGIFHKMWWWHLRLTFNRASSNLSDLVTWLSQ